MSLTRKVDLFEISLGLDNPAIWMNDTFDVVVDLRKGPKPDSDVGRFQLRLLQSTREYASLMLWDCEKKKIAASLNGPDLEAFLFRAFMRVVKPKP